MEIRKETVSERIQFRRKYLGLTLAEVSKRCGLSEPTVQRWETGNIKTLKLENLSALAAALETTPAYLMGWEEEDKTKDEIDREAQEILDAYNRASPEIRAAIQRILKD